MTETKKVEPMQTQAPRRESLGEFDHIHQIYYGTDDGYPRITPREERVHDASHVAELYEVFQRFEAFYHGVAPERRAMVKGGTHANASTPPRKPG